MDQTRLVDDDVRSLLARILELKPEQIDPDARLVQDLGMDSMMALEIVATLERKYAMVLPEAELANVKTLNSIIDLVKRHAR